VARHFVGQGRTYIRCDDRDISRIDIKNAMDSFLRGHVLVSYGLIAELSINGKYRSGELVPRTEGDVQLDLRVLGPHWVHATQVQLYSNGKLIKRMAIPDDRSLTLTPGVQWQGHFTLPWPEHDVNLVAIAIGQGIDQPYWKTAKPYQPTSPDW